MAVSLATTPAYPTRKAAVAVSTSGGGNFARIWVTDAPTGSELKARLTESGSSRLKIADIDNGKTFDFQADRGGTYVLATQEYTKGAAAHGGAYSTDPDADASETKVGAEGSTSLTFGTKLTGAAGTGEHKATLTVWVWGTTIRATTASIHGETTPSLTEPTTNRARIACADSNVVSALSALSGVAAATALGTLSTVYENIRAKFNAHLTQATVHQSNDTDNDVTTHYSSPSDVGLPQACQELAKRIRQHYTNDDGSGFGTAGYHKATPVADLKNLPLAPPPSDVAGCVLFLADAWRSYEAHRVSTTVHNSADSTNTLTALGALLNLHRYFLAATASHTPTAPSTENAGAVTLSAGAGMTEG